MTAGESTKVGSTGTGRPVLLAECTVPTDEANWRLLAYGKNHDSDAAEVIVLIHGDISAERKIPVVRLHSACLTGEVLGSLRCDCSSQLIESRRRIAHEGAGLILYLPQHEGRGIGLVNKVRAYRLQEDGHDTASANIALGLPTDARNYDFAASVLLLLSVTQVRLLTNNPLKEDSLIRAGLTITERLPLIVPANLHNQDYMDAKVALFGHYALDALDVAMPHSSVSIQET